MLLFFASLLLMLFSPILPVLADTPVFDSVDWGSLDDMVVGQAWSYEFNATSTHGGISYAISSGSIPGLSIHHTTGVYSGTPTTIGSYAIVISATDSNNDIGTLSHTFVVKSETTLSITGLTTSYPYSGFVTDFPVWVVVQLTPSTGVDTPEGEVVHITTDNGGPSCTATIDDSGYGDCGLTFASTGEYVITAAYAGSTYYLSSPSDTETIQINSAAMQAEMAAGRYHSCTLSDTGWASCWGSEESYTEQDSEGTILSSVNEVQMAQLSAGGYHTCGLKADGSIQCWGDSPEILNQIPNQVNGYPKHYIKINSGDDHVCAIDSRNEIHCWGQLTSALSLIPTGQFIGLDAGVLHDCAVQKDSQELVCWGNNTQGQTDVPVSLGAVKQVSVGNTHTCVIKADDSVDCWGTAFPDPSAALDFQKIDSGSNFSCGLTNTNTVHCWGTNSLINDAPTGNFSLLASGLQHTCAIDEDVNGPYLSCWGNNDHAQAPVLSLTPETLPEYLPLGNTWSQEFTGTGGEEPYQLSSTGSLPTGISLSGMTLSGTLNSVGDYNFGIILNETYPGSSPNPFELKPVNQSYTIHVQDPATSIVINSRTESTDVGMPVNVQVTVSKSGTPDFSGFVSIDGNEPNTSCQAAVDLTGQASCSLYFATEGEKIITANYDGDDFYNATTTPATTTTTINPIVIEPSITAGDQFNCSLDANGQGTCWGEDDSEQTSPNVNVYTKLSAGTSHVCGITAQSGLSCWGWNGFGVANPASGYGFVEVTSGETHSCARNHQGRVTCWGNSADQLTTVPGTLFSPIVYLQIDAGAFHTCGIRSSDNHVLCWGTNTYGQSNPGGYSTAQFTHISAGETATCGILTSGNLACWGTLAAPPAGTYLDVSVGSSHACAINTSNQLVCWGDSTDGKTTPPAGNYSSVQSGNDHNCALREDGYLKCWGNNTQEQAPVLSISPENVPELSAGQLWNSAFSVLGGRDSNYTFSVINGSLPPGLILDSNSGQVSGTLTTGNDYLYTLRVFEENLVPALINEKTYQQRVKAHVEIENIAVDPINPVVGEATWLHFSVIEADDSAFNIIPGGNIIVSINGVQTCHLGLTNGEASCLVFFDTPGEKTIFVDYSGDERFLPADTTGTETVIQVTPFVQEILLRSGDSQTYIHLPDGTLSCIGDGCDLTLFNGLYPVFESGDSISCGLQTNGQVLCKMGSASDLKPGPYQDLAVGDGHVCALDLDGEISCWGTNDAGQATPPTGSYNKVFAGEDASCAIRTDTHTPDCWGNSALTTPPVMELLGISLGAGFACGLDTGGSIHCWGGNTEITTKVPNAVGFEQISAGENHVCARDASGLITCWGTIQAQPADSPYGVFSELNSRDDHSCALRSENEITCWGENGAGEAPQILVIHLDEVETPALTYWEHFFEPSNGESPYTGTVSFGSLPTGTNFDFSPSGLVIYGTPTLPGRFDFALRWEDSGNPQLVLEELHRITVTGVDLLTQIEPAHDTTALFDNDFSFTYTFTNQTVLSVPETYITITLPNGMEDITYSGLTSCSQNELTLVCPVAEIAAHNSVQITVNGHVSAVQGETVTTSAVILPTLKNWPDINPTDNQDSTAVKVEYSTVVLSEDFTGTPSDDWLTGAVITAPSGQTYLGDFDHDQDLRLLLENLPDHREIKIEFDLYVIGNWQGNGTVLNPLPAIYQFGPTSGQAFIRTTFCHQGCTQAYPGAFPGGVNNPQTGAEAVDVLGFPGDADSVYHFTYQFEHTDSTLDLTWLSENLPDGVRFGLDQVLIELDSGWKFIYLPLLTR